MNGKKIVMLTLVALGLAFTGVFAGDVEKGKALFNDTKFADGKAEKSCNSCHPNGKGLDKAADKKEFNIMGEKQKSLEEAVNFCIKMALQGTPIDPKGSDMANIVEYIKSLKGKEPEAPKK